MVLDSSCRVTGFGTWKAGGCQLNTDGTEAAGTLASPLFHHLHTSSPCVTSQSSVSAVPA